MVAALGEINADVSRLRHEASFALDPLGEIIGEGVDFIFELIEPLQDLLRMVTGDESAIEANAQHWRDIEAGLEEVLSQATDMGETAFSAWVGVSSEACQQAVKRGAEGVDTLAGLAGLCGKVLETSAGLMSAAQAIIRGMIAELVEYLVISFAVAAASAVPTAGGSVVAAEIAAIAQTMHTIYSAIDKVLEIAGILGKIAQFIGDVVKGIEEISEWSSLLQRSKVLAH